MRYFGVIGVLAALIATPVCADNVKKPCVGLREETDRSGHAAERDDLLLTEEQCEAAKRQEFRLKLYEIPQAGEDPMALSLGAKQGGGIIRFKIPFSW